LGSSLFARHYSGSRGFFPFLGLLRCFSSPAYRCPPYVFRREHARITTRRFPHSEIPGSEVGQHLTRAYRSRPRPSSALGAKASTVCPSSLDREEHVVCRYGVFKVHAGASMSGQTRNPARRQVSQNSAVHLHEVDILLGELATGRIHHGRVAHRSKSSGIPRKEVIQPQLPLRLPCYDFTPVTDPTFDGFLPCGLEHRLRVLPASVV
jgi:hypothetical protein